jgi:diketogulonate reductase-like aldo/keto reductase
MLNLKTAKNRFFGIVKKETKVLTKKVMDINIHSTKKLNNGVEIPIIGLGTWQMQEAGEIENAVKWALKVGYRLIDTAKIYGNEAGVGKAIRESGIPREQIFVTTKLWNEDQERKSALQAIDDSLKRLELDCVDLYLIHWPFFDREKHINKREETWKAMEEIYKSGKAKAIGVSNYIIRHLEEMKKYAAIQPAANQVEFHPFLYQAELLDYCQNHNIVLEAYSPLIHGQKMKDERITKIAEKHGKSSAQILIRWSLQHGCVVIPKSSKLERIEQNIGVFDFVISDEDMKTLDGLNENLHTTWDPNTIP